MDDLIILTTKIHKYDPQHGAANHWTQFFGSDSLWVSSSFMETPTWWRPDSGCFFEFPMIQILLLIPQSYNNPIAGKLFEVSWFYVTSITVRFSLASANQCSAFHLIRHRPKKITYEVIKHVDGLACPNCHKKHLPHGDEIWTLSCHATRPCGCRNKHGTICSRLYNMLICILDMYYVYCKYNGYMYTICCICTKTNYIVYTTK